MKIISSQKNKASIFKKRKQNRSPPKLSQNMEPNLSLANHAERDVLSLPSDILLENTNFPFCSSY